MGNIARRTARVAVRTHRAVPAIALLPVFLQPITALAVPVFVQTGPLVNDNGVHSADAAGGEAVVVGHLPCGGLMTHHEGTVDLGATGQPEHKARKIPNK